MKTCLYCALPVPEQGKSYGWVGEWCKCPPKSVLSVPLRPPVSSDHFEFSRACNCVGPQGGQPLCPCQMASVTVENGRFVKTIDLGPAT